MALAGWTRIVLSAFSFSMVIVPTPVLAAGMTGLPQSDSQVQARHLVLKGFGTKEQAERAVTVLMEAFAAQWRYQYGESSGSAEIRHEVREDAERGGYLVDVSVIAPPAPVEAGEVSATPAVAVDQAQSEPVAQEESGQEDFPFESEAQARVDALREVGKEVELKAVRVLVPEDHTVKKRFVRRTDAARALMVLKDAWAEQWQYQAPDATADEREALERLGSFSIQEDREQGGYLVIARGINIKTSYRVRWRTTVAEPAPPEAPTAGADIDALIEHDDEKPSAFRYSGRVKGELGWPAASGQREGGVHYANLYAALAWQPAPWLEMQVAGRVDGNWQQNARWNEVNSLPGEVFIRWRGDRNRLTIGRQSVIWGSLDAVPLNDRLSRVDLRRGIIDDLQDRRLAVPMVRWEQFMDGLKLDFVLQPEFTSALLPALDSYWSPIDQRNGLVMGVEANPLVGELVSKGTFGDESGGWGGAGLRLSQAGEGFDWALTVQRFRSSTPYYELNPAVRSTLLATGNSQQALSSASGDAFIGRHPLGWGVGGDLSMPLGPATLRMEAVYLSDVPVTTNDLRLDLARGVDWGAGIEWNPGDAEARLIAQVVRRQLLHTREVVNSAAVTHLIGSYQDEFFNGRWRMSLAYTIGLEQRDFYWKPELTYLAHEPHQLYLAAHLFSGKPGTMGGYYEKKDLLTVGWRMRF